jgi:hypothetical protein
MFRLDPNWPKVSKVFDIDRGFFYPELVSRLAEWAVAVLTLVDFACKLMRLQDASFAHSPICPRFHHPPSLRLAAIQQRPHHLRRKQNWSCLAHAAAQSVSASGTFAPSNSRNRAMNRILATVGRSGVI